MNKSDRSATALSARRILRASEQIAIAIQERMSTEELKPGDRLGTEEQLAAEYSVSRPTLREALRILSSAGLVRPVSGPRGGILVERTPEESIGRSVSDSIALLLDLEGTSIEELLEAREMLEVPLARFAATRAGTETVRELRAALAAGEASAAAGEPVCAADSRFHRAVASASGNRITASVMDWAFEVLQPRLTDVIGPLLEPSVTLDQLRAILRAVEARDPRRAEAAMRAHLGYLTHLVGVARSAQRE